ncbi:hypothetical protein [Gemmata sp.]|uniref:hypothetical protein n=1 Tax=Gemmata sp. TaxID=1914242 RepID=UPI003F730043
MSGLDSLSVVPFAAKRIPNEYPGGDLPWQVYHTVRNAIVATCRRCGPTGPMGVVKIVADAVDPYLMLAHDPNFWERGDQGPTYYILDDQPNSERYCYAELLGDDSFNACWLLAITATLREFDGWELGVSNIPGSYVLIFGNRLMVRGRLAKCRTATEVVETAQRLIRRGRKRWWQVWRSGRGEG